MAAFIKHNAFIEAVFEKQHNLQSDVLKLLLSNVAPVAANSVKADLTEITAGNGYLSGGITVTVNTSAQASGLYKLVIADVTLTASGGSIGPFRYASLYNDTHASDGLIGSWDYGSSLTLATGESTVFDFDDANGVLQAQ